MKNRQSIKGITLIETMIAIYILTVGIIAVLYMFPLGTRLVKFSQMTTVAAQISQAKMEEIISKSYVDISSEPKQKLDPPFNAYSRETEVTCFDPNGDLLPNCPDTGIKKIKVTVSWGATGKDVSLVSLIAKK